MKNTKLISAFPGCGKFTIYNSNENEDYIILDSDSSTFDKKDFLNNYIRHIENNIGKADIILISSHKEVRDALVDNDLAFTLVYPNIELKESYISRYKERGSPEGFINLLESKWDEWITECVDFDLCKQKIELQKNEFLADYI